MDADNPVEDTSVAPASPQQSSPTGVFDRESWMRACAIGAVVVAFGAGGLVASAAQPADAGEPAVAARHFESIAPIEAGSTPAVVSVEQEEVELPALEMTQEDSWIPAGTTKVVSTGDPGIALVTYRVTTVAGVEVERVEVASLVTKEPAHDIVAIGTLHIPKQPSIVEGSTRDIGQELAAARGWTDVEWRCLDNLWQRESNWRTKAENKSSGAYGIPQALPGRKMASHGADWKTNPSTQIAWGLDYIKDRYGTPCGAWAFFSHRNWY